MTCIVGFRKGGKVWIGGDSLGVAGMSKSVRLDRKVFKVGEYVLGFTSSFRMGQILQYQTDLVYPVAEESKDLHRFAVVQLIPRLRAAFHSNGMMGKNDMGQDCVGQFLIGYRDQLWCVESDFQVSLPADPFYCIGSGAQFAAGAMEVLTTAPESHPEDVIKGAIAVAEKFCCGVGGPVTVENT